MEALVLCYPYAMEDSSYDREQRLACRMMPWFRRTVPPRTSYQALIRPSYSDPHEPLGLLFIAGYVRTRGLEAEAIDFLNDSGEKVGDYYWQGAPEAEIEAEFRRRRPRVVAIASMFGVYCHGVHRVAAAAKRAVPDAYSWSLPPGMAVGMSKD